MFQIVSRLSQQFLHLKMGVARLESVKKHGHGMFALFAALFMRPI